MARLSDTAALRNRPASGVGSHTVSSRKIDNGYMISRSSYDESTGQYKCSEEFSKNPPIMTPPEASSPRDAAGSEGLAGTKSYLGKDV